MISPCAYVCVCIGSIWFECYKYCLSWISQQPLETYTVAKYHVTKCMCAMSFEQDGLGWFDIWRHRATKMSNDDDNDHSFIPHTFISQWTFLTNIGYKIQTYFVLDFILLQSNSKHSSFFFSMKCLLPKLLLMLFFLIYFCFWVNKPIIFVLIWEVYRVYKWRIDVTVKQFFNNYLIQISESIGWQKSVTHKRPPIIESDSHFIDSILLKTILSPF